jgi:putative transposase
LSAAEWCRKHGISDATFYKWRAEFGGMDVSEVRRLKPLEDEDSRLERSLAEQAPDIQMKKRSSQKMTRPDPRFDAALRLIARHGSGLQPRTGYA